MRAKTTAAQANPFPGLRPFNEDEEYLFFGRENHVDAMVDKLARTRFLAVIGASGSGKSSLVNCGLQPALHRGLMARAGTAWRIAQFRPGSDPLRAMAQALAKDGVLFSGYDTGGLSLEEVVETTLGMSKLGLIDLYEQARLDEDVNLLVVVDQFEELFRYRDLVDSEQAQGSAVSEEAFAFVNLLLEADQQAAHPIYVVLTMRSDFLGDCAQFPGLAERINEGQYLVPRMTRDERRAAISGPVGVGGAEISPVLLTRLVNDVGDNPDQLSILQHALNRTWARWQHEGRREGQLDLEHYEAIGTMAEAIDQHAEKAYSELDTERQRRLCEKLFKALTDKATDARGIRSPTKLGALCDLTDASEAELTPVIDVFRKPSRSFLMPPGGERLERETVIDISHESLMRRWERLKRWSDQEAQSAHTYRRLAETAALHSMKKASLLRDLDLQLALDWHAQSQPNEAWAKRYGGDFSKVVDFIQASEKEREQVRHREQRALQAQADAERSHAKAARIKKVAAAAVCGVVVLSGLLVYAYLEGQEAEKQTQIASSEREKAEKLTKIAQTQKTIASIQRIAAESKLHLEVLPQRSLSLALEAVRANKELSLSTNIDLPESEHALREVLAKTGGYPIAVDATQVADIALSPPTCENILALAGRDGRIQLLFLDQSAGTSDPPLLVERAEAFESVAFSNDCEFLAAGSSDEAVWLWKLDKLKKTAVPRLHKKLEGHTGSVVDVEFSPNGRTLASASWDKTVRLWGLERPFSKTNPRVRVLEGHEGYVQNVEFSPDGERLASASWDKTVRIWDLRRRWVDPTPRVRHVLRGHGDVVTDVAFGPIGYLLASASWDKTIRVWNLRSHSPETDSQVLYGHKDKVVSVALSDDRRTLVSASSDKALRLWQVIDSKSKTRILANRVLLGHDARLVSAVFHGNDDLISAGDGEIRRWDLRGSAMVPQIIRRSDASLSNEVMLALGESRTEPGARTKPGSVSPIVALSRNDERKRVDSGLDKPLVPTANDKSARQPREEEEKDVVLSSDGRFSVSGIGAKTLRLWRQDKQQTDPVILNGHQFEVTNVVFSPDNQWLASADKGPSIRLLDLTRPEQSVELLNVDKFHIVTDLAFSSADGLLASAGRDRTVRLWNPSKPDEPPQVLQGHEGAVNSIAFSEDGRYLASASRDGKVLLWDLKKSGRPSEVLGQHDESVTKVAFSRNSRHLAAASDKTIRLWSLNALERPRILQGHEFKVERLVFSSDAEKLAAIGENGQTIGVWTLNLARLTELACERVGRWLTDEEKETFIDYTGELKELCSNSSLTFMSK